LIIQREQYWLDFFESYKQEKGYNKSPTAGNTFGVVFTEERKRKISLALVGKMLGEKNPFYGQKHSEETKEKMRENHIDSSGENSAVAKLTYEDVKEIRKKTEMGTKRKELAKEYNVSKSTIDKVVVGDIWKDSNYLYSSTRINLKLSCDIAKEIRKLVLEGKTQQELTDIYDVHVMTINDIVKNKTFKDSEYIIPTYKQSKKLNKETACEIRQRYINEKLSYDDLALEYKVEEDTIARIIRNKIWIDETYKIPDKNIGVLTLDIAREIRKRYENSEGSYSTLAKEYGVGKQAICKIVQNKTWKE